MKTEFFAVYGCYIGKTNIKLVVTHDESLTIERLEDLVNLDYLYPLAREATEGWDGMYGFEGEAEEEEEDFNCRIEGATEYWCEIWNEEEHAPVCSFGGTVNTHEIEI